MSAALAHNAPQAEPARLRLVPAPGPAPKSWQPAKHYRRPDPELLAKFEPAVFELLDYARRHRLKAIWFTFTSKTKGSREAVRRDLKRCWARFRHCSAWRHVLGAVVVFATHGRPHIHFLAVLPGGLTPRAVYRVGRRLHEHRAGLPGRRRGARPLLRSAARPRREQRRDPTQVLHHQAAPATAP